MSWCCRCNRNNSNNSSDSEYDHISNDSKNRKSSNHSTKLNISYKENNNNKVNLLKPKQLHSLSSSEVEYYSPTNISTTFNIPTIYLPPNDSFTLSRKCINDNNNKDSIKIVAEQQLDNLPYKSACELLICHPLQNIPSCRSTSTSCTIQSNDMREKLREKLLYNNDILQSPLTPPPSPLHHSPDRIINNTNDDHVTNSNFLSVDITKLSQTSPPTLSCDKKPSTTK